MTTLAQRIKNDPRKYFLMALTSPVIYGLIVPFVIADVCGTVYQALCFPVYGIPKVRRRDYVLMDRGKLAYLTPFQKLNCIYCEYANGVIAYVGEITARTEWFWCPIKHERDVKYPHDHYPEFLAHGDADNFRAKLREVRKKCRACEAGCRTRA
ncbi:MAG: hypothetical protein EPN21_08960 [Methylococcaceae bacterium]|nr:MAG: hypothetical protein EPN21_08960 [Methylococcaceae bacterium]